MLTQRNEDIRKGSYQEPILSRLQAMKTAMTKRSLSINGHKTSVSLEAPFWDILCDIARSRKITMTGLITEVHGARDNGNLSSALRLFVLQACKERTAQPNGGSP